MKWFLLGLLMVLTVSFMGFIVYLNIWYHRERAKLTPEQRKQEDEELRAEGRIW